MMDHSRIFRLASDAANGAQILRPLGWIEEVRGPILRAVLDNATQGMACEVKREGQPPLLTEVIGVNGRSAILSPFGATKGITVGNLVRPTDKGLEIVVGDGLLGRVIDSFGAPIDGLGEIAGPVHHAPIKVNPKPAMERPMIAEPLESGLRVIDGLMTLGKGQRIGIFGAPGTGKSTLLASLASNTTADVIVVGLIGERGREVREFIERDLPVEKRARVVVVVATSDQTPVERIICAHSATSVAEYFRDQNKSVFLLIDSLTRTARALREVGLAAGEPPTRRGYPASVYPALPAIIERAGRTEKADITAIYTVLSEGEISSDPIAEEVKSLTDGHILLSRELAEKGHYPAIDVLESLSRSMSAVTSSDHQRDAMALRKNLSKFREIELLLQVGEYRTGSDTDADAAIKAKPKIDAFLQQNARQPSDFKETLSLLSRSIR